MKKHPRRPNRARKAVRGKVASLLQNDQGDLDGWRLNNGVSIHFPVEAGYELSEWINVGNAVHVIGELQLRNEVDVIDAHRVESQGWRLDIDSRPDDQEDTAHLLRSILGELKRIRRLLEDK